MKKIEVCRCNNCDEYHGLDALFYIQPDVGIFCPDCKSEDLDFLDENEIIDELNELRGRIIV